jgi:hypothetical protein
MARNRIILGAGQCGMKLAHDYYTKFPNSSNELVALSTSTEDSVGIPKMSLVQVANEGSGKKFSSGSKIWEDNFRILQKEFDDVESTDIIYFTSAGGGSGSSSVRYVADIVLEQGKGNRIFLVMVLPFGYESLPFKPNTLRSVSALQDTGYVDRMSILLFDNDRLSRQYFDVEQVDYETTINTTNLEKINDHIVESTSLVLDLINVYHDPSKFSPFTIDEIEHESVIFSNGFIGVDSKVFDGKSVSVRFDYGTIASAKNVIIAKSIRLGESDYILRQNAGNFLEKVKRISRRAKNARIMYGIVRTDKIDDATYIIIANNLDISKYIDKVKNKVGENVEGFLTKESRGKLLTGKERNLFDI